MKSRLFGICLSYLTLSAAGCATPPSGLPSLLRNPHNYQIGQQTFARAAAPTRAGLDGTWRLIGIDSLTLSQADLDGVPFPVQEMYADAHTTLHRQTRAQQELTFAPRVTLYQQDGLGASLSYVGAPWLDQGPQSVYLDSRQRAALFPVMFRQAEHSLKSFACRALDEDRLICQVKALLCDADYRRTPDQFLWNNRDDFFRHVLSPAPSPEAERDTLRALNEQVAAYYIYARQR